MGFIWFQLTKLRFYSPQWVFIFYSFLSSISLPLLWCESTTWFHIHSTIYKSFTRYPEPLVRTKSTKSTKYYNLTIKYISSQSALFSASPPNSAAVKCVHFKCMSLIGKAISLLHCKPYLINAQPASNRSHQTNPRNQRLFSCGCYKQKPRICYSMVSQCLCWLTFFPRQISLPVPSNPFSSSPAPVSALPSSTTLRGCPLVLQDVK